MSAERQGAAADPLLGLRFFARTTPTSKGRPVAASRGLRRADSGSAVPGSTATSTARIPHDSMETNPNARRTPRTPHAPAGDDHHPSHERSKL
ncbi:hypothetical protein OG819_13615 [Streptomyces sp. NBC_01549]|uniref:hypothetical protein n=1 Tax=Streptomyces sp. NBC_01549 TaxID=2975874 RepID=UPI00225AA1FD|nr:hypothetical protein [Streptomyces sp. NBC_01549]MCX4590761.1 hypothetical protein [Streptomyces sp. NBC_01549]